MDKNIFNLLQQINHKPKPYEYYTTPELWCDLYISKQMLATHLSEDTDLASRKTEFIDRSVAWIVDYFHINSNSKICDFGCGPGLYANRFAKCGSIVTGVDFSETSINYAKAEADRCGLNVNYVLEDYLKFDTDEKYDLITMIYCDFCVLNPEQRKLLLEKFYSFLADDGKILLDVFSYSQYAAREENCFCEYSEKDGFWSAEPYYVFHNHFKYEPEHLLLDKFSIIDKERVIESYNWAQCYDVLTIMEEFERSGFNVINHYANVAGDSYDEAATEIAIVAEKR